MRIDLIWCTSSDRLTNTLPRCLVACANQFGERLDGVQKGLRTCHEGVRVEQKLSGGGEICLDWSNSSVITFGMFEPARGLGETEV